MRITQLELIPVAFPDPPLLNSWGVHAPFALRVILRLHSDEGLTGLGEAQGGEGMLLGLRRAEARVVGADPYDLNQLRLLIRDPRVFGAVEVACLDLIGRATGRPLYDLLGGRVRNAVDFSAYLFFKQGGDGSASPTAGDRWGEILTPEAMVRLAHWFVDEHGFQALKVKGGVLPPAKEIETMRLLREAFPGHELRIDPNAAWTAETSVRFIRETRDLDLEYVEDPTWGIAGMAAVRQRVDVPLSTNMCVTTWEHIAPALRAGAVDVILLDHHFWGGLRASQELSAICRALGMGVSMHSNSHLGVSLAAMAHLAATLPNLLHACDTHYPWLEEDVLAGGKLHIQDGKLVVPEGPGLGVELDEGKLSVLRENYTRFRGRERDDVTEMRRRDPDWVPLRPRW
jgi:glucarate dehydratase